jgi:hypothetical protein
VRRILVGGRVNAAEVGLALQAQSGAQVADLISDTPLAEGSVPPSQMIGVVGALS